MTMMMMMIIIIIMIALKIMSTIKRMLGPIHTRKSENVHATN